MAVLVWCVDVHGVLSCLIRRFIGLTCFTAGCILPAMKFSKKKLANGVIIAGGVINAIVIILILYFFVF